MSFILLFLVSGMVGAQEGDECLHVLVGSESALQRQVTQINPDLLTDVEHLHELYLRLKEEERQYLAGRPPSRELWTHVLSQRGSFYEIGSLSESDQRLFYINALRGLYVHTARVWKSREVQRLSGGDGGLHWRKASGYIMDSFLPFWVLEDRLMSVDEANRFFAGREWQSFPWRETRDFVEAWSQFNKERTFDFKNFARFWAAFSAEFGLDEKHYSLISRALTGRERSLICCYAEDGCRSCPHNRHWRKRK